MRKIWKFILSGAWIVNTMQSSAAADLTSYDQQDILAIREVAVVSYRNEKTNNFQQVGEIIKADTGNPVGRIYEHPRCYIVGYFGFLCGDWFPGETNANVFGFSGSLRKDCADCIASSKGSLQELIQGLNTTKDIVFTGLKEGGAIASLSAIDTIRSLTQGQIPGERNRIKLATFNTSSVGNVQFANEYKVFIPLENSLSFVHHDDYPRGGRSFTDFGKVGLPVRILPGEAWADLSSKTGTIVAQGSTVIGGSTVTLLGGLIAGTIAVPATAVVVYKLPAWLGVEPYGAPSADTISKAFAAVKTRIQTLGYQESLEFVGERPLGAR